MKNICIAGSGYVGLITGVCLASLGNKVTCTDTEPALIQSLQNGSTPIFENGLESSLAKNLKENRIAFSTDFAAAARAAEVIFICVGTPPAKNACGADLSYVFQAAQDIGQNLGEGFKVVVLKSTVPVGTAQKVKEIISRAAGSENFALVSNPEFLREGNGIYDFLNPDRIVLGADSQKGIEIMREIYKPLTDKAAPLITTDFNTASIIKYASNSFLAMKITFINEIADLCEKTGADITTVSTAVGADARIGRAFLSPGPGIGGACFPKDTMALAQTARENGAPVKLIETVIESNKARPAKMFEKIKVAFNGELQGKTITALGITFKAQTDDIREAPSITILNMLNEAGAKINIYDPQGKKHGARLFTFATFYNTAALALQGADGAVILTEWQEFQKITAADYKKLLKTPLVVDLRNIYSVEDMQGLKYISIGRK